MQQEVIYELSEFYKVFGDVTRLKILNTLCDQKRCVSEIAEQLHMTHSSISHQLKVLRSQNFVKNEKVGKTVYYTLADTHIVTILKYGYEHILERKKQ